MAYRHRKITYKRHTVLQHVPCRECGSPTPSLGYKVICPECKEELKRKHKKIRNNTHNQYHIISTPKSEYSYNVGASFSPLELKSMLECRNNSLDNGTILRRGNQFYIVVQDEKLKQNLLPVNDAASLESHL